MGKPLLFHEAALPEGFPPPGPTGRIVVKDYPACRVARVRAGPGGVTGGANGMFGPLFDHIRRHDIPMTAPVEIGYPDASFEGGGVPAAESMAFLYGRRTWGTTGPDEVDPRVTVEDVPATTVVSIGVRGNYTDGRFAEALARLTDWLSSQGQRYRPAGPPRYLGYNSPFVPGFLRYGEVQLPIEPADEPPAAQGGSAAR